MVVSIALPSLQSTAHQGSELRFIGRASLNRWHQIGDTASRIIGMRLLNVGDNDNFTMTLTR